MAGLRKELKKQIPMFCIFLSHCFLVMFGSEQTCGNLSSSLNIEPPKIHSHTLKIMWMWQRKFIIAPPNTTYFHSVFRDDVCGIPKQWRPWERILQQAKPHDGCVLAILLSRHVCHWKIMWQSKFIIEPPNKTYFYTNIFFRDGV